MDRKHFEGLDALRGIGALIILLLHMCNVYQEKLPHELTSRAYLSVDLFFILSGFVIGHVYEAGLVTRQISLLRYAETRILRLYPLIVLAAIISAVLGVVRVPNAHFSWAATGAHAAVIPSLWQPGPIFSMNVPEWSLFFELFANVVHALVAPWLRTWMLALLVLLCAAAFALAAQYYDIANIGGTRHGFLGGIPRVGFGFFAGLLLCRLTRSGRLKAVPSRFAWLAFPAFPLLALATGLIDTYRVVVDTIIAILALPIIVWAGASVRLSGRWAALAVAAGLLSYPLYILHDPFIHKVAHHIAAPGKLSVPAQVLAWLLVGLAICAFAAAAEALYDKPFRRFLGRRLATVRNRSGVATAP